MSFPAMSNSSRFRPACSTCCSLILLIIWEQPLLGASIEAIDPDPVKRRESGIIDYVDKHYNQMGVKLVAVLPIYAYNIVLRDEIGDRNPSLKGLKIRTASLVAPLVKAYGGAPVTLPPGEIYTSLQKGVIDGFTLVAVGLKDYKIYEVAGYLARPTFGYISTTIFMNLDKYNRLTDQEKQWVDAAGIKSEKDSLFFSKQNIRKKSSNSKRWE